MAISARRWLLAACFFVCPLIFFTNLTRNPYVGQIALLNAALALALAAWAWAEAERPEAARVPRLPPLPPLALFLAVWGASWARAYLGAVPFFRPSIAAQGAHNGLFFVLVCLGAFLLSASVAAEDDGDWSVGLTSWLVFTLVWGLLWVAYPQLRSTHLDGAESPWVMFWDPVGAAIWLAGLGGAGWLARRGRATDFLHLAFCAGFLASVYGVLQYFNAEFLWPYTLNPYGGRAVSTFGNPNFLSSFDVILMPMALAFFLSESRASRRVVYAALFLVFTAALLSTLTRSSWLGALAACALLAFSPRLRRRLREEPRPAGLLLGAAAALAVLWPSSEISSGYAPTVIGRLTEVVSAFRHGGAYSPWHQRVLIWSCAWLMGSGSPLLGRGGGLFELLYPFYQGWMLHQFAFFHSMRTHANNAHNEILEVFSQTGLAGLGAYLAAWSAFFIAARRWAKTRLAEDPLWCGCVAGCAGMLVDNMLNVSLHFAVPGFLFWWAAGTAMGRGARHGAGFWTWRAGRRPRRAAAAAVGLAAAGVVWLQFRVCQREAWFFSGFKLARRGELEAARGALEKSRSWGPREVNALYELGNAYARLARPKDALDAYLEALKANAGYDEIYYNIGAIYALRLSRPDLARPFYERAWAINPLFKAAAGNLEALYLRPPHPEVGRALVLLHEAVRSFPDDAAQWNNLGYACVLSGRWDEAQSAYERALSLDPGMLSAQSGLEALASKPGRRPSPLIAVLRDLRLLDAAAARGDASDRFLTLARSAAARAPSLAKARFLYGSMLLARGRAAQAVPELEAAARLAGGRAVVRLNLGRAYAALGRRTEAAAEFRAALADEPGNAAAARALAALGGSP